MTVDQLLAIQATVRERIAGMYRGDVANPTEGRQVLHTALRRPMGDSVMVELDSAVEALRAQVRDEGGAGARRVPDGEPRRGRRVQPGQAGRLP